MKQTNELVESALLRFQCLSSCHIHKGKWRSWSFWPSLLKSFILYPRIVFLYLEVVDLFGIFSYFIAIGSAALKAAVDLGTAVSCPRFPSNHVHRPLGTNSPLCERISDKLMTTDLLLYPQLLVDRIQWAGLPNGQLLSKLGNNVQVAEIDFRSEPHSKFLFYSLLKTNSAGHIVRMFMFFCLPDIQLWSAVELPLITGDSPCKQIGHCSNRSWPLSISFTSAL